MATIRHWFDRLWHRRLGQPYYLARPVSTGDPQGRPVLMLHGLGKSGAAWKHLVAKLHGQPLHLVALDLLGFGESPKPDYITYTVDDHARAVIATIGRLRLAKRGRQLVIVGHSMGCLVAVRVARLRPDLVSHLVLYEMPLYNGLPDKRRYRLRTNLYFRLYERVITYRPIFKPGEGKRRAQRLAERLIGLTLSEATWRPFIKSLKHTIMEQTTADDIKQLPMPMEVIYGSRDRVVIRGKTKEIFGEDVANITAHTIRENHSISQTASAFLARRILYVTGLGPAEA